MKSSRNITWIAVFIGLWLIRTWCVLYWAYPINEDAYWGYIPIAENIFHGRGYSMAMHAPYLPTAFRAPGYPLFLAAFYCPWPGHPLITILIQSVIDGMTALMLYRLTVLLTDKKNTPRLACLLFLLYPFTLKFTATFFRDGIFALQFVLCLWLFFKAVQRKSLPYLAIYAVAMGGAIYVREDGGLFWGLLAMVWLWKNRGDRRKAVQGAGVMLISLALLVPWTVRNYVTLKRFIPLSSMNFVAVNWTRANLDVTYKRLASDLSSHDLHLVSSMPAAVPRTIFGVLKGWNQRYLFPLRDVHDADLALTAGDGLYHALSTTATPAQFDAASAPIRHIKGEYVRAYPVSFVVMTVHRFFHYVLSSRLGDLIVEPGGRVMRAVLSVVHLILLPMGIAGLLMLRRARFLAAFALVPFALMALTGWPEQRYAMPVIPLILLGTAFAINKLWEKIHSCSRS